MTVPLLAWVGMGAALLELLVLAGFYASFRNRAETRPGPFRVFTVLYALATAFLVVGTLAAFLAQAMIRSYLTTLGLGTWLAIFDAVGYLILAGLLLFFVSFVALVAMERRIGDR